MSSKTRLTDISKGCDDKNMTAIQIFLQTKVLRSGGSPQMCVCVCIVEAGGKGTHMCLYVYLTHNKGILKLSGEYSE